MDFKSRVVISAVIAGVFIFTGLSKANVSGSIYLHKPKGIYGVGYNLYHLINEEACPNVFFKESNTDSFGINNSLHCNEIELIVYYPTNNRGSSVYQPISSLITDINSFSHNVSKSDIRQIKNIRSYSIENTPSVDKKFPVIFFSPGYGLPTQEYENTITELVSNGYIVIGVNSQFINGGIAFNKAKEADVIAPETEEDKKNFFRNSYLDLAYVFKQLNHQKLSDPIFKQISWDHIFLLGHSLGAAVVARFAKHKEITAVATLDLTIDLLEGNACHQDLKIPFMHMFSSQMYQHKDMPYLCKANESLPFKKVVIINGNNTPLYSMHMNFCDYSTLQYAPAMTHALTELKKNPKDMFLGTGNGKDITTTINHHLQDFFDKYAAYQ